MICYCLFGAAPLLQVLAEFDLKARSSLITELLGLVHYLFLLWFGTSSFGSWTGWYGLVHFLVFFGTYSWFAFVSGQSEFGLAPFPGLAWFGNYSRFGLAPVPGLVCHIFLVWLSPCS